MCSIVQNDVLGNSVDKDMVCKCTRQIGAGKYLKESCYHCIKCSAANFLTALIGRRPLNSTALATPTYRRPERVFDGISTQVVA